MDKVEFGKTGMKVSRLGFGGAEIGFGGVPHETVEQLLNAALDGGLNVIDTAECYADSEEKIGATVSHRRDDYYLFTKCGHTAGMEGEDWEPAMLRKQIDRSLSRLKTSYVDLLQLHSCSLDVLEKGEAIEVALEAKQAGKCRFIGYSGDSITAKFAVESGVFDTLQTSCNLFDQECVDLTLPLCRERGMGVIAKRPIGNVAWKYQSATENSYASTYWQRQQELAYSSPDMVDLALRFTLSQGVHVAIVGASSPARFEANSAIVGRGPLSAQEVDKLRARWSEVSKADWVGQQ